MPPLTCLNVNFPDMAELKGIKICEQAKGRWTNEWEPCPRKGDDNYFWLIGEFKDDEPENEKMIIGHLPMGMLPLPLP